MAAAPYADLTPDRILDALAPLGLVGDGRLLALNSYENRVYLVYLDDGAPVVAKFYRPGRWTDAQIEEEHAFVGDLAMREIPGRGAARATPAARSTTTAPSASPCIRSTAGARPRSRIRRRSNGSAASSGRIHAVGALQPFVHRPALDIASFGDEPRAWLLANDFVPRRSASRPTRRSRRMALASVRHCFERAGAVRTLRLHGDCHASNILWTDDGPHFVDFDDARTGPCRPGPVDAAVRRSRRR